jgi:hypothetical protein
MPHPPERHNDPGYYAKVNYVITSWARPCEAPWYIYIETLWPAALEAFITLLTFGWDDVARGYFRPRGLNMRRTKKGKGKWRRAIPRFPELGEELGKRLPGAEEVKGEKWSALGKTLWRIDTVAQRALFWWLVADVTVDFAYNWTSLLYETEWCQASALGRFSYQAKEDHIIVGLKWSLIHYGFEDYEYSPPHWAHTQGGTGSKGAFVTASATVKRQPGQPEPTAWGIGIFYDRSEEFFAKSGPATAAEGGAARQVIGANVPPNTAFQVKVWVDVPFARVDGGVVVGYELE